MSLLVPVAAADGRSSRRRRSNRRRRSSSRRCRRSPKIIAPRPRAILMRSLVRWSHADCNKAPARGGGGPRHRPVAQAEEVEGLAMDLD